MLRIVTPCAMSARVDHTVYGKLYDKPLPVKDRIMPTLPQPFMNLTGSVPFGVKTYVPTPIITLNPYYAGRFAIQDQPRIEKKPPWERVIR